MRRVLWFLNLALFVPLASPVQAGTQPQAPRFSIRDAIQAEWARQPLTWIEAQKDALPPADRARLERTLQRIGAPGAPALLPPELEKPTLAVWEAKALAARTPQERFTALFMLNRLKSPKALMALAGLIPTDAAAWPKHLHLEASLATARLNGAEVSPALQAFLDARQQAGKVDPVRAQAARLRLVMAGKEKELLPLVEATPGSLLALMDAAIRSWNGEEKKSEAQRTFLKDAQGFTFKRLGLSPEFRGNGKVMPPPPSTKFDSVMIWPIWHPNPDTEGALQRIFEMVRPRLPEEWLEGAFNAVLTKEYSPMVRQAAFASIGRAKSSAALGVLKSADLLRVGARDLGPILNALRSLDPAEADKFRSSHLGSVRGIELAAWIDDFPQVPEKETLRWLNSITFSDQNFEPQQTLIQSYARWKMNPEDQKTQLRPWLQHPDWACRWEAYQALVKLDPATPWPTAPKPSKTDEAILKEAMRLAERGKPVRLRITFGGKRQVTLRLDPSVAPMNVANLVLLARKGYFNGRLVPRVVPDFVVQMGSPYDTMDGGPGYTVRCEDSLDWYGPGSIGMALSGKDTGGSQFFITTNATPHLTGRYTRLGEVEDLDRAIKVLDDLELGAKILSIKVLNP